MSKICPKHNTELARHESGGVVNYSCPECGRDTMTRFFPSADPAARRNARVQARYDELTHLGKHGHYETMFQVVREEVERARPDEADSQDAAFILWFEDAGKEQILFSGFGAADAAHRAYAEAKNSWNCHLFKKVAPTGALASATEEAIREAALEDVIGALRKRWKEYRDASVSVTGYSTMEQMAFGGRAGGILEAIDLLKSKSAHSPAPRVEEATMREMLGSVMCMDVGELKHGVISVSVEQALAFGRALMERKP